MGGISRRQVTAGSTVIEFGLRRSQRRRRTIEISVDAMHGVLVAAPVRATIASIEDLVRRRAPWILKRIEALRQAVAVRAERQWATGETLLYLGREYGLRVDDANGVTAPEVRLDGAWLEVRLPEDERGKEGRGKAVAEVVEQWYRWSAGRELPRRVAVYAPLLGVAPSQVLVRPQERRWGSCARDGTLRFNWRLVMAPPPIVDYVVVHELCHLRHLNHGPQFWEMVGRLIPDYQLRRRELRREGDRYRL